MWGIPGWALGVGFIILIASLAKSFGRMLRAPVDRIGGGGASEAELARQREALEEVQKRLGELEERVDFAERLLAKQREGERLAPPRS